MNRRFDAKLTNYLLIGIMTVLEDQGHPGAGGLANVTITVGICWVLAWLASREQGGPNG